MSDLVKKLRKDFPKDPRISGSPEMELRWKAACEIERLTTEVSELKTLIADVASAPFPIHDHCSKEHWERACHIYKEATDSGSQK